MAVIVYTVSPGDTLSHIAEKFGTTVETIMRANGIIEPDKIYPDQRLRIPVFDEERFITYTVQPGDTLYSISNYFDVSPDKIAAASGLEDPDTLAIDQVLRIPITEPTFPNVYTVRPGDTLYSIAKKFNTTVADLINLNKITTPNLIYPGQQIKLR